MKFRSLMTAICVLATANIVSAQPFAYVANSGTKNLSVIDTVTNAITATVGLGKNAQDTPYAYGVAVGASGQYVYVGLQTTNEVVVIDTATNTVVKRIDLQSDSPGGLAVNAAETRLYVASNLSNTLMVIDITGSGASMVSRIAVEDSAVSNPDGVALLIDSNKKTLKAYVSNSTKGNIAEISIDETVNSFIRTNLISLGNNGQPMGLTISSDGKKLYAASLNGHASVIDTDTRQVTDLPLVSGQGFADGNISVAITPDNSKIYAPSSSVSKIYTIDGTANTVSGTPNVTTEAPFGSSVTPDGSKLFLTMGFKSEVQVFDTANLATTPAIIDLTATAGGVAKPISQGDFIGPLLPNTITATPVANCDISPSGTILVNNNGRIFSTPQPLTGSCELKVDGASFTPKLYASSYTFSNVTSNRTLTAVYDPTTLFTLSGDWISSVGGCLVSSPAGINCNSKSAKFPAGTVTLTVNDSNAYRVQPGTWTGACAGTVGNTCTINLAADAIFGASTVVELKPIGPIVGPIFNLTKNTYHQTCPEAFSAATTGDQIKISTDIASCITTGTAGVMTKVSNQWKQADYSADPVFKSMPLTITNVGITVDPTTGFVLKL